MIIESTIGKGVVSTATTINEAIELLNKHKENNSNHAIINTEKDGIYVLISYESLEELMKTVLMGIVDKISEENKNIKVSVSKEIIN